jgi:hypothetical protein
MKYIPLNAKDRSYIDEHNWNWQFLRNVQRILNVLKGSVMTNDAFFHRAFGSTKEEFLTILHMPERILMYRGETPKVEELDWLSKFSKLSPSDKIELLGLLCINRNNAKIKAAKHMTRNKKVIDILELYSIPEDDGSLNLFE